MNKYALGTIVGTSLLGLVKSKLGSNIRLKTKTYGVAGYAIHFVVYGFVGDEVLDPQINRDVLEQVYQKYQYTNPDGMEVIKFIECELAVYDEEEEGVYITVFIDFLRDSNIEEKIWEIAATVDDILEDHNISLGGYDVDHNHYREESSVMTFDEDTKSWKPYSKPKIKSPKLRKR